MTCIQVLLRVLLSMGIISKDEREMMAWPQSKGIYPVPELDIVFKEVSLRLFAELYILDYLALSLKFLQLWADNGDALSRQYSGTAALKRDFTRTGKRTIKCVHRSLLGIQCHSSRHNIQLCVTHA